ncbi:MAG: hypothetical protein M3H12_00190, partial [Chromatiales bacterium]
GYAASGLRLLRTTSLRFTLHGWQRESVKAFEKEYSVLEQAANFVQAIEDELDRILGEIEAAISAVTEPIAALIRAPFNMAAAIAGSLNRIRILIEEPFKALSLYEGLFSAGSDSPAIATTTPSRLRQAQNTEALHNLVRRIAIAEAAITATEIDFDTADDALAVRDRLLDAIDAQMEIALDDAVYQALADLRAAIAEDFRIRAARLPEIGIYTPLTTLPAVVVAHQAYGDATRESELVTRNRIRHPGFVPGGESLEVFNV